MEKVFHCTKKIKIDSDFTKPLKMLFLSNNCCPIRLSYFLVMKQCFSLTTFQHKHQHKPNFSISEAMFHSVDAIELVLEKLES
jgi:hypothetical protein